MGVHGIQRVLRRVEGGRDGLNQKDIIEAALKEGDDELTRSCCVGIEASIEPICTEPICEPICDRMSDKNACNLDNIVSL